MAGSWPIDDCIARPILPAIVSRALDADHRRSDRL